MFDIFYNLQADTRIESGASVISYLALFASGMHNTAQAELVGEDNCFFILTDGAALEISREASTHTTEQAAATRSPSSAMSRSAIYLSISLL